MSSIPRSVLSEHLEERLAGRRVVSAIFTTYQLDPGFFEQHVLPVVLGTPVSQSASLRLVQLEDSLKTLKGEVAVYYDADGLVDRSDFGPAKLDVRRVPIRVSTGVFHPKNVFVLVESPPDQEGNSERALLVSAMSANLTRSGWWSNVEAAHFEEISEGDVTRSKVELAWFLNRLRHWAAPGVAHRAVQDVVAFLRGTGHRKHRTSSERLHPHFYAGRQSVADFLEEVAGTKLRGAYLDVISPFFDQAATCAPLEELKARFAPKEIRVYLPRSNGGEALCSKGLYSAVERLGASWGHLPREDWLRQGKSAEAETRYVHAKVYRFFTQNPKAELLFVGSVNLTRPAHQRGGNVESGFLVEIDPGRRPESWLTIDRARPQTFESRSEREDEGGASEGSRLQLRYAWSTGEAFALWGGDESSPELRLEARGRDLGLLAPLTPGKWTTVAPALATEIGAALHESSFFRVHGEGSQPRLLLVQEESMGSKPSLMFKLSVADILRYWALLTPDQRAAFIEARAPSLALAGDGAALVAKARSEARQETLFDRFAGFFHAFASLERSVREALDGGNERHADYLLFGRKYDSLGTLLDRVLGDDSELDVVERYVLLLCAEQLRIAISNDYSDFWESHGDQASALAASLGRCESVRARVKATSPDTTSAFLPWFERWFLTRARPAIVEVEP